MADQEHGAAERTGYEVAVVGMAGRFPGADDIHAFWSNLREGVESISFFTRGEVLEVGTDPVLAANPDFVPARGEVRGAGELDAALFGLTPRDAEILDPQHRLLLECAWSALEHAGCDPARAGRPVGMFAGSGTSGYVRQVESHPELARSVGRQRIGLWNDKDQLAAGVSYRLDLRGPSLSVQTACSTSLVAVHLACQSLVTGECDMALAGGVSVQVPLRRGHLYNPDGIGSPDGHCRAFDADSRGTVGGTGVGVVVLKRLEDALAEGDTIHAVIRGSAINNDGAEKVGYTAPSVAGQARVISEALSVARVDAASLQYLEAHGSGTPLGDAIELKALGQVLGQGVGEGGGHACAIGSVKSNVGHLDAAAGVTGLIKTVLALKHREIPPSLHCAVPHAGVEAMGGRVFVNTSLRPWERNGTPRRAGVSSFGIGGTNAHVVLEEAPPREPSGPSRALQLLVVSARTETALARAAENLAAHLQAAAPPLADAAFTLQTGRRELEHRLAVVCRDAAEGAVRLRQAAARASAVPRTDRPVAFLFPGLGMHHVDMARGLYDAEPVFRAAVDESCELLRPLLGRDLREVLYSASVPSSNGTPPGGGWDLRGMLGRNDDGAPPGGSPLDDTRLAQPAVFVTEYALAVLWMSWGVKPRALLGHSLGEYVAACVSGVLRLDDALRLVALRAQLIGALPAGAMLAVPLGAAALREILPGGLDLAAVNTPGSCVVSGPPAEIEAFEAVLAGRGTVSRRLVASHAFHSRAMAPVAAELERLAAGLELRAPAIPFVSNVTGTWITDDEARSPAYWGRHLCQAVRFADGVATLREEPGWVLLEVGPGQTLGAWALQHPAGGDSGARAVLSSLRHPHNRVDDLGFLLESLGGVWAAGAVVDWTAFSRGERRHRIPLPGYPFERRRYWVDAAPPGGAAAAVPAPVAAADGVYAETAAGGPVARPIEQTHHKGPDAMENGAAARVNATAPLPRHQAVLDQLRAVASELTGIEEAHVETDVDLFRAGFDSLLLLQGIQAIEKRMGIRLSLVEVLEDMTSLDALAHHIDRVLPPGAAAGNGKHAAPAPPAEPPRAPVPAAFPTAPSHVPAPPAFYPAPAAFHPEPAAFHPEPGGHAPPADAGSLERLLAQQFHFMAQQNAQQLQFLAQQSAQQLQLVGQQLALLRGDASAPVPAPSPAPAPPLLAPADAASAHGGNGTAAASAAPHAEPPPVSALPAVPQSPRAKIQPETFVAYQPVNTERAGGMTPWQKEYLDGFMARYVERTRASKAHQARYHAPLADSRVTARFRRAWKEILYPIVGDRALGSRVWDLDGNEYVDIGMAFGCNLFGHAPAFVSRAIREQVERGYGVGPQSAHAGRAAELVCALGGNDRAVFCNSGTEAVMGAVRAARAFTGRSKVAVFAGSYHGWSDLVQGRLMPAGNRSEVRPTAPGVPALPLGDVLMLEWDQPASLELLARELDEIALVMVEPVQSRRLDIQPRAFLHELRRMTREAGVLLHFDELITGFRIGAGGAQAHFGVQADLVTYGKIVAGGLPMGVVAGRREVMDVFDGGAWRYGDDSYPTAQRTLFAGAYFKHPLSMAVACSILEEVERRGPELYARLNERTTRLVERCNAFFEAERFPIVGVHFSSCFRFFFGPEVKHADLWSHHLILEGIHVIPETGTNFLSDSHTDEDVEAVFQAVCASARAMRRGGLIPPAPAGAEAGGSGSPGLVPAFAPAAGADGGGVRVLPVTEGQRQLWIESQMGDDANRAYIEALSIRLHGVLDVDALRRALQALVDRHDTLRATFAPDGDRQLIHPPRPVDLPVEDLGAAPADEREARIAAWARGWVQRPFDMAAGPLFRFALCVAGPGEHVLVFATHHAVLDGWSFGVLWKELGVLYAAAREGRPVALPPRPDHADQVRARNAALLESEQAQAFWREQFADGVPVLELPADRPRPPARGYAGGRVDRVMGEALMSGLAAAGRPHGLNMFHVLLAAVFAWLGRLSGDDDVVVGAPAAGQAGRPDGEGLIGYGIQILPVRARLDGSLPFVEHARRVRRTLMGALQHRDFSFPRLVDALLPRRDPSRSPVFSVLMNLDVEREAPFLGDLRAELENAFGGGAKVDLAIDVTESARGLRLRCVYAAGLFDRATVERWLRALEEMLAHVARDPQARLSDLSLIGEAERRLVVEEWNRTECPYPHLCIHELFEQQARRVPDAVAVVFGGEQLTYAQLDARANQVAHHLRARGMGPEDRVALCLERGMELMPAFFGILKAGAAYVPLDPAHPADRLGYMLRDSGARLLLTQSWLADRFPEPRPELLRLDEAAGELAREPADRPESGVRPENLAYVYYTSGSTGRPKGVAMHHYGPANYFAWGRGAYRAADGSGAPVFSSMAVDLTLANFIPLFAGGRVELLREESGVEPLAEAIRRRPGFSMIKITPSHLSLLNPSLTPGEAAASTGTLVIGADSLPAEHTAFWRSAAPGVRLLNEYGPTETVVGCSIYALPADGAAAGRVPIGRPIDNLTMYVLGDRMEPLPAGIPGELYIGGVGVARGYLGRPGLTAQKFVPHPFSPAPGARLYRTGDRARFLDDGNLDFLGRLDFQVKIRGYRIEVGEVETVLAAHEGVRQALVMAREDSPGDRRLVAYVVPRNGREVTADELRGVLREKLPEFMLPSGFVFLDAFPLGSTGKVDRGALPPPEYGAPAERYVAPRTPLEQALAETWAAVLRLERVGVEESFFELGGDSILAIHVASRLRRAAVEITPRHIFEHQTIAALAVAAGGGEAGTGEADVPGRAEAGPAVDGPAGPAGHPVRRYTPADFPLAGVGQAELDALLAGRDGVEDLYPLSPLQEGLLFQALLDPGTQAYQVQFALRLEGSVDVERFRRAWAAVVARHPALRTAFAWRDLARPLQRVERAVEIPWVVEDWGGLGEPEQQAALERYLEADRARGHALDEAPLLRCALFRVGESAHWFVWSLHHLLSDGWSSARVRDEAFRLYRAWSAGEPAELAPAPPFRGYVEWLARQALDAPERYWRDVLAGFGAPTPLGIDRAPVPGTPARHASRSLRLDPERTGRLTQAARGMRVTLNTVLLGAWGVLLSRYGGEDDVVFGTTVSGRPAELDGVEEMVGLLMNTLPVRVRLPGGARVGAWLAGLQRAQARSREYEYTPLHRVQEWSEVPGGTPLFESLVVFENHPPAEGPSTAPGEPRVAGGRAIDWSTFPLCLTTHPGRELLLELAFDENRFDRGAIERMLGHLVRVLEQMTADAELPLCRLALLDGEEARDALRAASGEARAYPRDARIHDLVALQARSTPDAPAVVHDDGHLTYAELDARAGRLARRLRGLGVGAETRVAVCVERGPEMAVALLGVLRAGGACVPLDPAYPAERLAWMMEDSGAAVLLTRAAAADRVPAGPAAVLNLDAEREWPADGPADRLDEVADAGSLAYVVYTSGSTGRPKGVALPHGALVNFATSMAARMELGAGSRVLQFASPGFDVVLEELFPAWVAGAAVVFARFDVLAPAELWAVLDRHAVTAVELPTAYWHAWVQALAAEGRRPPASLRLVLAGGEPVVPERLAEWSGMGVALLHVFGLTETACTSATLRLDAGDDGSRWASLPVGAPTANVRLHLLDPWLHPAPAGVAGELFVGGEGVARGYLGRPGLTAERFVPDPFSPRPGARLYRTGDRMRRLPDGALEFLGRLDHQVKVRGFRIEPGEVERALTAHPGVLEARVLVREDQPGHRMLVAYVAGRADAAALRAALRESLPEHMVPDAVVVLERLPLTPHGKLDRGALLAPADPGEGVAFAAPRTQLEGAIAAIFAEALGRERVGRGESFFALGGHSLLAMRLISRVREAFGVELPVRVLFAGPTVEQVAERVAALRSAGLPQDPPIVPMERAGPLPLSLGQERLWFLDRLGQGGAAYNVTGGLRLSGGVDEAALACALREIVRRHDPLRTTFREDDGVPTQVIAPADGFQLAAEDLSALAQAEREAEVRRRAQQDAALPFDLVAGPVFRATLLRLAVDEHVLLLALHHAACDGWGMGVLFRELWTLYGAHREGRPSPLPPLPVRYADYAEWQRRQAGSEAEARRLAYWTERLAGAPELLELPTDRPRPPEPSFRGGYVPVAFPAGLLARLRALSRAEGATLYMVVLAAFQALLARYGDTDDVVVGTLSAGRTRGEVEELVGFFANTLVLRTDLSGDPTFRQALRRVRDGVLGAYEHQDLPFEQLVAALRPERTLSHAALFQVLFQLDDAEPAVRPPAGLRVSPLEVEHTGAKFDLTLVLAAHAEGIGGKLEYSADLFDAATARQIVDRLERLLEQVADDAGSRLSGLELLAPEERARLAAWNRTEAEFSAGACIHHLFESQARRTPDAPAVRAGEAVMTFAELDASANRIANDLRGLGVRGETRVGICLERGLELMPAILGVMKAGGAYVPMDPSHPAERLAYTLEDAGVAVLLTQERLRDRIPATAPVRVVALDAEWERIATHPAKAPEAGVTSENLCYVIYTSGSTGRPKGVAMHHRGVVNYIQWGVGFYGAGGGNGAPVFTSMAVDLTVTNLLPLFAGQPVRMLPEASPVEALAQAIRERPQFGLIKITPIHLGLLNSLLEPHELAGAAHTLVIGADFLPAEPTVPWQDHAPGIRLMNEYGPTETVVGCSAHLLAPGAHRAGPVPVGGPIQNLTFHVLDRHLKPVPPGLPGELYIGGAGVARGYLGRAALTAEKFVPDPFAAPGARMYRTGDRGRWVGEGNLAVLGRTDGQVKVRGYRVETGEVEAGLRRHPAVRESIVAVREDRPGDRRLVAYVVADGADAAALRAHLRASLPEYMVPDAFVLLDALPQTPTGKLDRKALPAPEWTPAGNEADAPRSYEEVELIRIWEELLGVEGIGLEQSFFELGGNSLLALRLFAQVNRRMDCDLPLSTLFAGATVRRMAQAIQAQRGAPAGPLSSVVPLQRGGAVLPLFVVHASDPGVMGYVNLVRHLGAEQPVYGLRDLGDDLARPIALIAAEHVAAVRTAQPEGPYYLAGWSFGGFVAYEMALQLERQGQAVAFVGLIDTMSPEAAQEWPWNTDADLVAALANEAADLARHPVRIDPGELEGLPFDGQVRRAVEILHASGAGPARLDAARLAAQCRIIRDRDASFAGYVPGRFPGTVTLFRAEEQTPRHEAFFASGGELRTLGWSRHVDEDRVQVHAVPGRHATVLSEPHVRTFAGRMNAALSAARATAGAADAPGATEPAVPGGVPA